jgi:CxxC motif-containing protein (DUF1111 family)
MMIDLKKLLCTLLISAIASPAFAEGEPEMLGGDTTVFDEGANAYSHEIGNFYKYNMQYFGLGNTLFNTKWVPAPNEHITRNGLGPLYNEASCSACHYKDGRGWPDQDRGMLFKFSLTGKDEKGAPIAHPVYGGQLQNQAVAGVTQEGYADISYEEIAGTYGDGETYSLRKPTYGFSTLNYGELGDDTLVSPRVAPPVFGMALLEAIPDDTLKIFAAKQAATDDGVTGKLNYVWDHFTKQKEIGRFGWKATQPSIAQQVATALVNDMGITNLVFKNEGCTTTQTECKNATTDNAPEVEDLHYRFINNYIITLGVPARRNMDDDQVKRGERIFKKIGCMQCHQTNIRTDLDPKPKGANDIVDNIYFYTEFADQVIHPYTDLLLHDMGDGLADGRPEFDANGKEWRTSPLWGIGLTKTVNGHSYFMHDGRARGFAEAILWHGGEGEAAKERFRNLQKSDRDALVKFLESL